MWSVQESTKRGLESGCEMVKSPNIRTTGSGFCWRSRNHACELAPGCSAPESGIHTNSRASKFIQIRNPILWIHWEISLDHSGCHKILFLWSKYMRSQIIIRDFFFFNPESILNKKQSKPKQLLFYLLIGRYTWEVRDCLMNTDRTGIFISMEKCERIRPKQLRIFIQYKR